MRAILTYHSLDGSGSPVSIDPLVFETHVRWLASGRVAAVPLEQLAAGGEGDAVALTFDDGFRNFATDAWPRLRAHGLPATLFVVSDHAGGTNAWGGRSARDVPTLPLLDWDDVARLAAEGVEIGAHTRTHPDLTTVDDARLADELDGGAERIAARTGQRPAALAYPYGAVNDRVAAAAHRYARAVTTELRPLEQHEEPLRLPRLDAYYFRGPGRLEAWGTPAFRRRLALRALARRARAALAPRPR